jgi:hypothetical protein
MKPRSTMMLGSLRTLDKAGPAQKEIALNLTRVSMLEERSFLHEDIQLSRENL